MTVGEAEVLGWLRRLDAGMDRLDGELHGLKASMTELERQVARLGMVLATGHAGLSARLDRVDGCLDRIERRLDLVEPAR